MLDTMTIPKPRIATEDELAELGLVPAAERREAIRRMFRAGVLVPVRGGSPDGDGDGGGDGGGNGDGDGGGDGGGKDGGDGDGDGDGAGDGPEAELQAELAKARKAAAEKDKELRELKRKQDERDREARESEGKYEELYNEEKAKREAAEKALEDFKAEVEGEKATTKAKSQVIAALKAEGVKNPERDVVHVDLTKIDSETAAKRAAKRFADSNPDLVDKAPTRQKRGGGDGDDRDDDRDERNGRGPVGPDRLRRHFAKR